MKKIMLTLIAFSCFSSSTHSMIIEDKDFALAYEKQEQLTQVVGTKSLEETESSKGLEDLKAEDRSNLEIFPREIIREIFKTAINDFSKVRDFKALKMAITNGKLVCKDFNNTLNELDEKYVNEFADILDDNSQIGTISRLELAKALLGKTKIQEFIRSKEERAKNKINNLKLKFPNNQCDFLEKIILYIDYNVHVNFTRADLAQMPSYVRHLYTIAKQGERDDESNCDGSLILAIGKLRLTRADQITRLELVKKLVEIGAFIDLENLSCESPLMYTVRKKGLSIANCLIGAGANVNNLNYSYQSPLIVAVKNNDAKSVELLLNAGADVDIKDVHDKDAFTYALEANVINPKIIKLLLNAGVSQIVYNSVLDFRPDLIQIIEENSHFRVTNYQQDIDLLDPKPTIKSPILRAIYKFFIGA